MTRKRRSSCCPRRAAHAANGTERLSRLRFAQGKSWQSRHTEPRPTRAMWERCWVRVLIIEDDDRIASPLVKGLQAEGLEAERVSTGAAALARVESAAGPRGRRDPARPAPSRHRRLRGVPADPRDRRRADHRGHGTRRGGRSGDRPGARSRRLRRQAVRLPRAARPDPSRSPGARSRVRARRRC